MNPAVSVDHQRLRKLLDVGRVMGDHNYRYVELVEERLQLSAQSMPQHGIQGRKRLVEQQQARLSDQAARQCDTLTLAAGKIPRIAISQCFQIEHLQKVIHLVFCRAAKPPGPVGVQSEADIGRDAKMREERIVLKQIAYPAPPYRTVGPLCAVEPDMVSE